MRMRRQWQAWYSEASETFGEAWDGTDRPVWAHSSPLGWDLTGVVERLLCVLVDAQNDAVIGVDPEAQD